MALDSLERFALTQLLGMAGVLRTRWDLMDFDVLGRERTTSGFYTLIQQHEVLESLPSSLELILSLPTTRSSVVGTLYAGLRTTKASALRPSPISSLGPRTFPRPTFAGQVGVRDGPDVQPAVP